MSSELLKHFHTLEHMKTYLTIILLLPFFAFTQSILTIVDSLNRTQRLTMLTPLLLRLNPISKAFPIHSLQLSKPFLLFTHDARIISNKINRYSVSLEKQKIGAPIELSPSESPLEGRTELLFKITNMFSMPLVHFKGI